MVKHEKKQIFTDDFVKMAWLNLVLAVCRLHLLRPERPPNQLQPGRDGDEPQERAGPDWEVVRSGTARDQTRY